MRYYFNTQFSTSHLSITEGTSTSCMNESTVLKVSVHEILFLQPSNKLWYVRFCKLDESQYALEVWSCYEQQKKRENTHRKE